MSDKSLSGNLSSQCRFQTIKDQTLTEVCECIILCLVVQTLIEKEKSHAEGSMAFLDVYHYLMS